jgi:hypothetical protein
MQLKNTPSHPAMSLRRKLSAATSALLGGVAPGFAHSATDSDDSWDFDAALLYYSEGDGRVNAVEPLIKAHKNLGDEESLEFKLVVDSLTGATPTGAVPSNETQTFTRPSGNGSYTVAAGEVPLDDTFLDTRYALSANWDKPLGRLSRGNFGINFSNEYDFQSFGLSADFSHDFNQRNTTLNLGLALEADSIDPEGGIPLELSSVVPVDDDMGDDDLPSNRRTSSETRDQIDLLFGVTQVISQNTIMQFNISHSKSDGYHNDPFKLVSIVDSAAGPNQGEPIDNIYESRPDSRSKTAFYWQTRHSFERDAIDLSYRYMSDDWGIESHTVDLHYYWMMDSGSYWQPHIRYYQQGAADFYRTLLPDSEQVPEFISADYRLGDLTGITYGLKYSHLMENDKRIEFRLEMMSQTNDPSTGSQFGSQANRPLILDTEAVIFQVTYSF